MIALSLSTLRVLRSSPSAVPPALSTLPASAASAAPSPRPTAPEVPPRRALRAKRRKPAPRAAPETPSRSAWRGISGYRRYRMYAKPAPLASMQKRLIETALLSSLSAHGNIAHLSHIASSAGPMCGRGDRPVFRPGERAMDAILTSVISRVERELRARPHIAALSCGGADVLCEAVLRAAGLFGARAGPRALAAVVRVGRADPVCARRAERALSVLRYARAGQGAMDAALVWEVFRACVEGGDVQAAAGVMQVAVGMRLCGGDGVVRFYNGVMAAALVGGDWNTVEAAIGEMEARGVQGDDETMGLVVAMWGERGEGSRLREGVREMRREGRRVADVVYWALIREAGRRRDGEGGVRVWEEWERERERERQREADGEGEVAGLGGKGDPRLALFEMLRRCEMAEEAVRMREYVRDKYGWGGKAVGVLVVETCWRAQRIDLGKRVRIEMEEESGAATWWRREEKVLGWRIDTDEDDREVGEELRHVSMGGAGEC